MTSQDNESLRDAELQERLQAIVSDHTQAGVARRTGRSKNALTRYTRGARMPLEFGMALVDELGINPVWLLGGDGPMYVSEVPASTSELGRGILELVNTMAAVSRVRLGSLTGRRHAQAVREVSDALDTYGSLRDKINDITAPMLERLLDDIDAALGTSDIRRALSLESVANRLEQMCDAPLLSARLLGMRAHLHYYSKQQLKGLEVQRRHFQHEIARASSLADIANPAHNLGYLLFGFGYMREARRVCEIALCFANENDEPGDLAKLIYLKVSCDIEEGRIDRVPAALRELQEVCPAYALDSLQGATLRYLIASGLSSGDDIEVAGLKSFPVVSWVADVLRWRENAGFTRRVIKRMEALLEGTNPAHEHMLGQARRLLRALEGDKSVLKEIDDEVVSTEYVLPAFVRQAQLLRLLGDTRKAAARTRECHKLMQELEADRQLGLGLAAVHAVNCLALKGAGKGVRELREWATRECKARVASGTRMFSALLDR